MMTVALIGGTGRVGGAVLDACLARGHTVRALVRNASRFRRREGVTALEGSVTSRSDLDELLSSVDAVVSALGTPPWALSTITAPAMEALLAAMRRRRVDRLIAISALGVGDSRAQVEFPSRLLLGLPLPYVRDKLAMERAISASETEWTIVRPWIMRDRPARGFEAGTELSGKPRLLTFADCAAFVADELEQRKFVRQAVAVSGVGSSPK
jgi:putative NADH-flavin reductase